MPTPRLCSCMHFSRATEQATSVRLSDQIGSTATEKVWHEFPDFSPDFPDYPVENIPGSFHCPVLGKALALQTRAGLGYASDLRLMRIVTG